MFGVSLWIKDNKLVMTNPYSLYRRVDGRWQTLDGKVVVPGEGIWKTTSDGEYVDTCKNLVYDDEKLVMIYVADNEESINAYTWGLNIGSQAMRVLCWKHFENQQLCQN